MTTDVESVILLLWYHKTMGSQVYYLKDWLCDIIYYIIRIMIHDMTLPMKSRFYYISAQDIMNWAFESMIRKERGGWGWGGWGGGGCPSFIKTRAVKGMASQATKLHAALHLIGFKLATNCCQFSSGDVANYTTTSLISWASSKDKMHYIIGNCCLRLVLLPFSVNAI